MHDKKSNLINVSNKNTVSFILFADGVKYSEQPHDLVYSLIDEYFSLPKRSKDKTKEVALIFKQITKNNG